MKAIQHTLIIALLLLSGSHFLQADGSGNFPPTLAPSIEFGEWPHLTTVNLPGEKRQTEETPDISPTPAIKAADLPKNSERNSDSHSPADKPGSEAAIHTHKDALLFYGNMLVAGIGFLLILRLILKPENRALFTKQPVNRGW